MKWAAVIVGFWLWHPTYGRGYQVFSGIGSSVNEWVNTLVVIAVALWAYWHHHQCHVHDCHMRDKRWLPKRLSWHTSPEHGGHPVCKLHHAEHPRGGNNTHVITADGLTGVTP